MINKISPLHKILPLDNSSYFEILGKSEAHALRSGFVTLPPGADVGVHSTENYEELIIVLNGRGELEVNGQKMTKIKKGQIAYNPPQTKHNVYNTGKAPLRYIYVIAKAI
jgi:mannose-6-phosphate isomerase-like protein (cupin superfamily)